MYCDSLAKHDDKVREVCPIAGDDAVETELELNNDDTDEDKCISFFGCSYVPLVGVSDAMDERDSNDIV